MYADHQAASGAGVGKAFGLARDRRAAVAAQGSRPVVEFVLGGHRLGPGLAATRAEVGLVLQQGNRPRSVLGCPQRLVVVQYAAEEDRAWDRPGSRRLYLAPEGEGFAEATREVGTATAALFAAQAPSVSSSRCT